MWSRYARGPLLLSLRCYHCQSAHAASWRWSAEEHENRAPPPERAGTESDDR